ncbi:MAG TPA: hypothetical protein VKX30_05335 [Flavobacteriaceae bacterium]|nr:hypothetical protein [Flavobacteriaceae bacterium]
MRYRLSVNTIPASQRVQIRGSKSESNRLLVLQKLLGGFSITNLSDSVDTQVLKEALDKDTEVVDIGHAGTAMRFLTAYYAIQEGKITELRGSERMHQRPIAPLVESLQSMGAEIRYLEKVGYPPLKIIGKQIETESVAVDASMSSQYVTALLLVAPFLPNGLQLKLRGEITSMPYIQMTLKLLMRLGIRTTLQGSLIQVDKAFKSIINTIEVESDWSSASYLYSFFALSEMEEMRLGGLQKDSLQGDNILQCIFTNFGVSSTWEKTDLVLYKIGEIKKSVSLDCSHFPDLAQTLAVTAFALGISLHLTGLHTLKIKETDRLVALKNELQKLGATIRIEEASLSLGARKSDIVPEIRIATYEDHRMAMAFAPLAIKVPIQIENPEVVVKSFPEFWSVWKELGISLEEVK